VPGGILKPGGSVTGFVEVELPDRAQLSYLHFVLGRGGAESVGLWSP
jgi:hypothetical protein